MPGLGNAYANHVLDALLGPGFTRPPNVWLALYTAAPSGAGGGTEVSAAGTGYARYELTNNAANFPNAASSTKSNAVAFIFPTAVTDWAPSASPVTHWALHDDATADSIIVWGIFTTAKTILAGATPLVDVNQMVVTAA